MALTGIDRVNVTKQAISSPGVGSEYRITFTGEAVGGNVTELDLVTAGCTAISANGVMDIRTIFNGNALTAGERYYVRARSINAQGVGEARVSTPVDETPRAPPAAPALVEVYAVEDSATSLLVNWTAPTTNNGAPLTSYAIEYSTDNFGTVSTANGSPIAVSSLTSPAPYQHTITGLTKGTTYKVRVVAINDQGSGRNDGSATEATAVCKPHIEDCNALVVPRALPSAPTSLVVGGLGTGNEFTGDTLVVSWATGTPTSNIADDMYKIEWDTSPTFDSGANGKPVSYGAHGFSLTSPEATATQYAIHALDLGQQYYIRVSARNSLGYGPPTAHVTAKPQQSPSAPTAVTLSRQSLSAGHLEYGTQLKVQLSSPSNHGGDTIDKCRF